MFDKPVNEEEPIMNPFGKGLDSLLIWHNLMVISEDNINATQNHKEDTHKKLVNKLSIQRISTVYD